MKLARTPLAVLLPLAAVTSCVGPDMAPIEGDDSSVFFGNVRASIDRDGRPPVDEVVTYPHVRGYWELELGYGAAESTQNVAAGESIRLDQVTIAGPASVDIENDLFFANGTFRRRLHQSEELAFDFAVGIGFQEMGVEVSSAGLGESEDVVSIGPVLGAGVAYFPATDVELSARLNWGIGIGSAYEIGIIGAEVGGAYALSPEIQLFLGWRYLQYEAEPSAGSDSDLELDLSGPTVSLQFHL